MNMVVHVIEVMINITKHVFRSQHGCLCKKQTNKQIDNFLCEVLKKLCLEKRADVINIGHFHILITGYYYFSCRMFLIQKTILYL